MLKGRFSVKLKADLIKNIEVIHHSGVKGMKWGVRNGPPYPIKNKGKVAKAQSTLKNADGKDIISVNRVELTGKPNSITQIQRKMVELTEIIMIVPDDK